MAGQERALVLGGGGVAGIAWETGVLAGLAQGGADVTGADLLVGTSAGANVAAQLCSVLSPVELLRRQAKPDHQADELHPSGGMSVAEVWEQMLRVREETDDPEEAGRRLGRMALTADTVPEADRRAVIADRLPAGEWPRRRLLLVAVDAFNGEVFVMSQESGVPLVDAVAASSALPGIWPAVTIGGSQYVDGVVRSMTNADLAAGCGRVLVVAPSTDPRLDDQLAALAERGAMTHVLTPDVDSLRAMGADPLHPGARTPSAEAGYAQGRDEAAEVAAFWGE